MRGRDGECMMKCFALESMIGLEIDNAAPQITQRLEDRLFNAKRPEATFGREK